MAIEFAFHHERIQPLNLHSGAAKIVVSLFSQCRRECTEAPRKNGILFATGYGVVLTLGGLPGRDGYGTVLGQCRFVVLTSKDSVVGHRSWSVRSCLRPCGY